MGIAYIADDFGTDHAVGAVDDFFHIVLVEGFEIAWPAATRLKLGIGFEQRRIAAHTGVNTVFVMVMVASREGTFGRGVARDFIVHGR